jgi:phosphoribosylaminoimidazole (AIR) synthetase
MTVVVAPEHAAPALALLHARGLQAWDVGHIESSQAPEPEARILP